MKEFINKVSSASRLGYEKARKTVKALPPIHSYKHSGLVHSIVKYLIIVVVFLAAVSEIVLSIMIFGFHSEAKFVKSAVKFVPIPMVYSSHGIVTADKYFQEKDYIAHFYSSTGQGNIDETQLSQQILTQLTENNIISDEGIKYKISISNEEVEDAYAKIVEQNGGQESVEKVLNDLYGLSVKQFKNLIKTQLLRDKFNTDIIERVTVRHILVRLDENATQEQIDAAKAKIEGYKLEITGGLSFADAAKKYSEDVGSNENGGLLDPFARGDMVKEFEDVAFSQPIGEVSAPFRSSFGWHILVVESRSGIIKESFDNWLSDLKKKSIIIDFLKV